MQFSVTSRLFSANILLNTLFSNTLDLCYTLNVRDKVSHPYKVIGIFKHIVFLAVFLILKK
jgi:hypothetical protein